MLKQNLDRIAETALRSCGLHDVGIYLLDQSGDLDVGAVAGMPDEFLALYETHGAPVDPILSHMISTQKPCSTVTCLGDRFVASLLYRRVSGRYGLQGFATLPLFEKNVLSGVLFIGATTPAMVSRLDTPGLLDLSVLATKVSTALQSMPRPGPSLTPRQQDVAELAAAGFSNRQIAKRLGSGEASVRKHLKALNRLYGTSNRTAMAAQWRKGYPNGD